MNKQEILTESIQQRTAEIFNYQINIDNYTLLINDLPATWPEELLKYRGSDVAALIATTQDEEQITLLSDLIFKDRLVVSLLTEKLEQRKAIQIKKVLEAQLVVIKG